MKSRFGRYRFGRTFATTAVLYWYGAIALLGLALFFIGFLISFQIVLKPLARGVVLAWGGLLSRLVPPESIDRANHWLGGVFLLIGVYLVFAGLKRFFRHIAETLNPKVKTGGVVDTYVRRQQLAQGPRIVALGGGTGLSTLLRGLKLHSSNITAIVTVTDDGGSSGRLVQEMGIIPPGDMRNCLVALADAEKHMTDLFQHRFKNASGSLSGHSIGNLLIAGLVEQCDGDFDRALQVASEVLAIRGRVIPSTMERVRLKAVMENDDIVTGETAIVDSALRIRRVFLDPANPAPHPEAIEAIRSAELICVGPGSVYTSVIPNLLVPGIADEINAAQCPKVYICNVMTQRGESDAFTAAEHVVALQANVDKKVFDYVMVNTAMPSEVAIGKYRELSQAFVDPDVDRIRQMGLRVITGNFMSEMDYVRHDPMQVAERLMDLLYR